MTSRSAPGDRAPLELEAARIRTVYARRDGGERYAWSEPGQLFMMQELERRILQALRREDLLPLRGRRILEIGCGTGHFLRELVKWGADPDRVTGIDLLEDRVARAAELVPRGVQVEVGNAASTLFPKGAFDVILQMTLFTSILEPAMRERVSREMLRLLAPGGAIVWYDFRVNNPGNPDVRRVGAGEIRALFPGCRIRLKSATLAPPIARRVAPLSWHLCSLLAAIPVARTHYLAIIRPRSA